MEKPGLRGAILRFARNVGIVTVCIFVLAGLFCLPATWRTFHHLGNRAMLLGVLAMVVGAGSLAGHGVADPLEQLPHGRSSGQRIKQRVADTMSSHRSAITTGIAGGVSLFLGDLILRAGLSALGLP